MARNLRVGGGRVELQPAGSLATPDVTASGNPQVRGAIYPASATERTGHPRASPVHLLFTDAVRVRAELLRCEDASGARPNLPPRTKRGVDDGFDPPDLQSIAAFLRSSIAARSVRWDQAAFDDHRPALWGELRSGLAQARRRTRFHSRSSAGQNQQNPHRRLTVSRPTRRIRGPRLTAVNLCRLFGRTEPRAAEQDRPSKDWLWN